MPTHDDWLRYQRMGDMSNAGLGTLDQFNALNRCAQDYANSAQGGYATGYERCLLNQPLGVAPEAMATFVEQVRKTCQCNQCAAYRSAAKQYSQSSQWGATHWPALTAADLGLRQEVIDSFLLAEHFLSKRRAISDAPYSFWLGAQV